MNCEEILELKENGDVEFKSAQGRDGLGKIPGDFWETYSSFANTSGGLIILGIEETKQEDYPYAILGIKNPDKVLKELWDNVNNTHTISKNILQENNIKVIECDDDKKLISIYVRRASREERPVYVKKNPYGNTFVRNHEGDYRLSDEAIAHLIADSRNQSSDAKILEKFDMSDIALESLQSYRNVFSSRNIGHPWLSLDDQKFLEMLGAWKRNRNTEEEGLTLAGLLMFGKHESIVEVYPNFSLDYREELSNDPKIRWTDRVIYDGKWTGNIYDFYQKVYNKLVSDLKVQFQLDNNYQRIDNSSIHEALREAFLNALVHSDYSGSGGIVIIKKQDRFNFRNPGTLRIPLYQIIEGGISDCRNKNIQKMFRMIGAVEQAGSGFNKILDIWSDQHWKFPLLRDNLELNETRLQLPMISFIPDEIASELESNFGKKYNQLTPHERFILAVATTEEVTNNSLQSILGLHAREITKKLQNLVQEKFLIPNGIGRGTSYSLYTKEDIHKIPKEMRENSVEMRENSVEMRENSVEMRENSVEMRENSVEMTKESKVKKNKKLAKAPSILITKYLDNELIKRVRTTSKVTDKQTVIDAILELCKEDYMSIKDMAYILDRSRETLRTEYVNPLVKSKLLVPLVESKSSPRQAYKTV